MGILTGTEIANQYALQRIVIDPFDPKKLNVKGNSYDVTIAPLLAVLVTEHTQTMLHNALMDIGTYGEAVEPVKKLLSKLTNKLFDNGSVPPKIIDPRKPPDLLVYDIDDCPYMLPGVLYLGATHEAIGSDHYVPILHGKSSLARLGLSVHLTAGFGEAGFKYQWTLEMTCVHPFKLYRNMRIGQVEFETTEGEVKVYEGNYKKQEGPTGSKMQNYFDKDGNPT